MPRRGWRSVRNHLSSQLLRRQLERPITVAIVLAILLGASTGLLFARTGDGDRVVVGNTGGTLSSVISLMMS